MKTENIDAIWNELQLNCSSSHTDFQRLVYRDLAHRMYVGVYGIPFKRFVQIEIPINEKDKFEAFSSTQGFSLSITNTRIKHNGYVACMLEATTYMQNDVFTIVIKDIIEELRKSSKSMFIKTLLNRINKWKNFFKDIPDKILSNNNEIGLFGELSFIYDAIKNDNSSIIGYWNGPISGAQDFQSDYIAVEVKTTLQHSVEHVIISSEHQLAIAERDFLFLVVYRIERNDSTGLRLPELIRLIEENISERQKNAFKAKLLCLGYKDQDANKYLKGYVIKEKQAYEVDSDFPKITKMNLPIEISNVKYEINISQCQSYNRDFNEVIDKFKECQDATI